MKQAFFFAYFLFFIAITARAQLIAFPGAEGYGKYATGGRGGKVLTVNNLNDSGPGSLRDAVEQHGPRMVLFAVDGIIELLSPLSIDNDSITIAGQSAPGDGICIKDYPLIVNASNVILRYFRVRVGDRYQFDSDGIGGGRYGQHDVIFDHLSVSWSIDECLSIYKTERLTVQWCLVSHSLNHSVHTKGNHGFGGIWGGNKATFHHNLLANHASRNPRFSSVEGTKSVDFRNNVVYNWGFKSAYGGGRGGEINMVANYYKPGPASRHQRLLDVSEDGTGRYYLHANVMIGNEEISEDNWRGVGGEKTGSTARVEVPFAYEPIKEYLPMEAYQKVLKEVGCSFRRDSYDINVLHQVRLGEGREGEKGIINSPLEVGGWPLLNVGVVRIDSDQDGMPDIWEKAHGLNPLVDDAANYTLSTDYTNVEVYLHSLIINL